MSLKFANHHLTRQPSHNSSLRYSALVKEDKVGYPLHAILRDLRRPLCVFNVQHDKVDVVLVGLLDLPSADTMVKDKLFTPLSCKLTPHIAVLGAIFGARVSASVLGAGDWPPTRSHLQRCRCQLIANLAPVCIELQHCGPAIGKSAVQGHAL